MENLKNHIIKIFGLLIPLFFLVSMYIHSNLTFRFYMVKFNIKNNRIDNASYWIETILRKSSLLQKTPQNIYDHLFPLVHHYLNNIFLKPPEIDKLPTIVNDLSIMMNMCERYPSFRMNLQGDVINTGINLIDKVISFHHPHISGSDWETYYSFTKRLTETLFSQEKHNLEKISYLLLELGSKVGKEWEVTLILKNFPLRPLSSDQKLLKKYAFLFCKLGDLLNSKSFFKKYLQSNPDDLWVKYYLGMILFASGDAKEASLSLEAIHAKLKQSEDKRLLGVVAYRLSESAEKKGDFNQQKKYLEESASIGKYIPAMLKVVNYDKVNALKKTTEISGETILSHLSKSNNDKILEFDKTNKYIIFSSQPWLDLGHYTYEIWFKVKKLHFGGAGYQAPLIWRNDCKNILLTLIGEKGNIDVSLGGQYNYIIGPPIELDRWTQVAVTFDGNKIRLYKNGNKVGERDAPKTTSMNDSPLIIGHRPAGFHSAWFYGNIGKFRIWRAALNDDEVLDSLISFQGIEEDPRLLISLDLINVEGEKIFNRVLPPICGEIRQSS